MSEWVAKRAWRCLALRAALVGVGVATTIAVLAGSAMAQTSRSPAPAAPLGVAGDRELTVLNRSPNVVNELYVSPSAAEQWGDDRLGDQTLDAGKSLKIKLGRMRDCEFDVQVVYEDGSHEETRKVNVCRARQVAFDGSAAIAAPKPPTGGEHTLTLLNNAGRPIQQVFISAADASQWGDDRLPNDSLSVGDSTRLTYRGDCAADMRVVFDNKAAEERRRLDLCETPTVSVEPGWTTADAVPTGAAPKTPGLSAPAAPPRPLASPAPATPPATVPPVVSNGSPAPPATAGRPGKTPVTLLNQSGHAAVELYLYPTGAASRGPDRLGAGELKDGASLAVPIDRGDSCMFTAHVVYGGKTPDGEQRDINLCTTPQVVLRP